MPENGTVFHVFVKTWFLGAFFGDALPDRFFHRFFDAPGQPQTSKIKQKPWSVARKQGFVEIEKSTPGDHFGLHFGGLFGAPGQHFCIFSDFLAFETGVRKRDEKRWRKSHAGPASRCGEGGGGSLQ